jgi:pimeloyl-ACP methyl ester carboxylesterase
VSPVSDFRQTPALPPPSRIDFEEHAAWVAERIEPGDHLVGHSYGGVIALLAAAAVGERLDSLTVIEPPCTSLALDEPAVSAFAEGGARYWREGPRDDPEAFLRGFLDSVGSGFDPPSPLPPALERGARALIAERGPWEAGIPLERLRAFELPTLVVSGAHHPAFDAICDALERELEAERLVIPGHGHNPQLDPRFTAALLAFVARAE